MHAIMTNLLYIYVRLIFHNQKTLEKIGYKYIIEDFISEYRMDNAFW